MGRFSAFIGPDQGSDGSLVQGQVEFTQYLLFSISKGKIREGKNIIARSSVSTSLTTRWRKDRLPPT